MDPQQEVFTSLLVALRSEFKKRGYEVYDGVLPPEDTPYPFIYIADSQQTDRNIGKREIMANVYQTIHIWHNNPRERGTVSSIIYDIKKVAYTMKNTTNFKWDLVNVDQTIINDDTTKSPLLHGVLNLEFYMTGGIRR